MKRIYRALICVLAAAALATACYTTNTYNEHTVNNIYYSEDHSNDHTLSIHGVPDTGELLPVIVEIHGGALVQGDKSGNADYCDALASYGYIVVNVNYTLLQDGDMETIVQDLFSVLLWLQENGEQYHMDLQHVYLDGDSAGGYLSGLMAAVLTQENLQAYYHVDKSLINDQILQVKGYALGCPMIGLDYLIGSPELTTLKKHNPRGAAHVESMLEDSQVLSRNRLMDIIDVHTYPPVYLLTTPEDDEIYEDALALHNYLEEQQVEHTYAEYKGTQEPLYHTFNAINPNLEESRQANADKIAYFNNMK